MAVKTITTQELYDLACTKIQTLALHGDAYHAWVNILHITYTDFLSQPTPVQEVEEKLTRLVQHPLVHKSRKAIYARYIGKLEN